MIRIVRDVLGPDAIVLADPGTPTPNVAAYWETVNPGRTVIAPRGHGPMGYAIPAAVGAAIASPKRPVVAFTADGSFAMACGELETVARLGLPILFVQFTNDSLGWIKMIQHLYFGGRYFGVDPGTINAVEVARACGVRGERVTGLGHLRNLVAQFHTSPGPLYLDIAVPHLIDLIPPVPMWLEAVGGKKSRPVYEGGSPASHRAISKVDNGSREHLVACGDPPNLRREYTIPMKVAIIGSGIIGLASAYHLARQRCEVVLLGDRAPGSGASSNNAGWIVPSSSGPLPAPGIVLQTMRWMLRPDSPVYVQPSLEPSFVHFMIQMLGACNAPAFWRGFAADLALVQGVMEDLDAYITDGIEFEMHNTGLLRVFVTRQAFQKAVAGVDRRRLQAGHRKC